MLSIAQKLIVPISFCRETFMKYISRLLTLLLFVGFFGFALKNDEIVTLKYFFGFQQSAPLVIMLLIFFIAGAVIGAMAMVPMVYRHRRDLTHHRKTLAEVEKERDAAQQAATQAPQPDSVRNT
ncbi:hypothetical protein GCM10010946_22060 [Undibacterium squillarum]|uniref:Lipopolysaccharide assembly protein A domain-containing protein n=2 Tax=Undibacterium squillarum TaxID=1131567 RepID=A0ABQ2XZJ4_9BURK|nr:hypothetical protein GCM10010946_22060 [Undibacterium squillarum]